VEKPVSKFAFQVHNLQRYRAGAADGEAVDSKMTTFMLFGNEAGCCTLESS
jgi:hypothetical protein